MDKRIVIGIDTGLTGGIAYLDIEGNCLEYADTPVIKVKSKSYLDEVAIREALEAYPNTVHIFIEKASTRPMQSAQSGLTTGTNYGILRGICVGLKIPYSLILPQTWKKNQMPGAPKDKGASIVRVKQLYPDLKLPGRKKDDGICDAVLIARYGLKEML